MQIARDVLGEGKTPESRQSLAGPDPAQKDGAVQNKNDGQSARRAGGAAAESGRADDELRKVLFDLVHGMTPGLGSAIAGLATQPVGAALALAAVFEQLKQQMAAVNAEANEKLAGQLEAVNALKEAWNDAGKARSKYARFAGDARNENGPPLASLEADGGPPGQIAEATQATPAAIDPVKNAVPNSRAQIHADTATRECEHGNYRMPADAVAGNKLQKAPEETPATARADEATPGGQTLPQDETIKRCRQIARDQQQVIRELHDLLTALCNQGEALAGVVRLHFQRVSALEAQVKSLQNGFDTLGAIAAAQPSFAR